MDEYKTILLTKGKVAIVDADDFDRVSAYRWYTQNMGYAARTTPVAEGKRLVLMHRFIMEPPDGLWVDHINGDTLDNRRINLRLATPRQNSMNQRSRGGVPYRGVSWNPRRKQYQAKIKFNGKQQHLGWFNHPIAAALICDRAAIKYGEGFIPLNFPGFLMYTGAEYGR